MWQQNGGSRGKEHRDRNISGGYYVNTRHTNQEIVRFNIVNRAHINSLLNLHPFQKKIESAKETKTKKLKSTKKKKEKDIDSLWHSGK